MSDIRYGFRNCMIVRIEVKWTFVQIHQTISREAFQSTISPPTFPANKPTHLKLFYHFCILEVYISPVHTIRFHRNLSSISLKKICRKGPAKNLFQRVWYWPTRSKVILHGRIRSRTLFTLACVRKKFSWGKWSDFYINQYKPYKVWVTLAVGKIISSPIWPPEHG
jgi:hypothetical protein